METNILCRHLIIIDYEKIEQMLVFINSRSQFYLKRKSSCGISSSTDRLDWLETVQQFVASDCLFSILMLLPFEYLNIFRYNSHKIK